MSETSQLGILAFGAYIPRLRLQRASVFEAHAWFAPGLRGLAKGERAIANWDEDSITMAVEAGRDCLAAAPDKTVAAISLASTTLPFADRQNAGIVKEALNLQDAVRSIDVGGSQRAGTAALIEGLNAAANGEPILAIAAEKRRARPASELELVGGDAAAAFLVGRGDVIARFIGSHSLTIDFVDHFRAAGNAFDYSWESRWIREEGYGGIAGRALAEALRKLQVEPETIDHFIVPITARGVAESLAKKAGIRPGAVADNLALTVGETGAAHASLLLAHVLEGAAPGARILIMGFGQGCDVLLFEATEAVRRPRPEGGVSRALSRRKEETNYLKCLFFSGLLDLERGMRAEGDVKQPLTALYRNRKTVLGLVGGRCSKTGTVQFPRSEISVNSNDHAVGAQEDYPLADRPARILTYTADHLTYSPDPPQCYGMVEFEGGGRMMADFTDAEPDQIEVGKPMRMMFRIKNVDEARDFTRYFWKAAPRD